MKTSKKAAYFYTEFLKVFFIVFFILLFIFLVRPFIMFTELITDHFFSLLSAIKFFSYAVIMALPDLIPLGFFVALLGVVARMNLDREYWALLTCGISGRSLLRTMIPVVIASMVAEFIVCFMLLPAANFGHRHLLYETRVAQPIKFFKPRTLITQFPGATIYVSDVKDGLLRGVEILSKEGSALTTIRAESGTASVDFSGKIYLHLNNGTLMVNSAESGKYIVNSKFAEYVFTLTYPVPPPDRNTRKINELRAFGLIRFAFSRDGTLQSRILFGKKVFLVFLPVFYLFLAFYGGLGLRMKYFSQIVAVGAAIGFATYFFIIFAETVAIRSGIAWWLLISPLLLGLSVWALKRKFSHVA